MSSWGLGCPHSSGLPGVRNPAPSQAREVRCHPLAVDRGSGQASAGLSPKPFMIESPMVSTRSGATTTGAAGVAGVAAGTGVGFDIAAPPEAAVAVECADGAVDSDDAERRVVVDRATHVRPL